MFPYNVLKKSSFCWTQKFCYFSDNSSYFFSAVRAAIYFIHFFFFFFFHENGAASQRMWFLAQRMQYPETTRKKQRLPVHTSKCKVIFFSTQKYWYFNFSTKNVCCGYSLEAPGQDVSNKYLHHIFLWISMKKCITWIPPLVHSHD